MAKPVLSLTIKLSVMYSGDASLPFYCVISLNVLTNQISFCNTFFTDINAKAQLFGQFVVNH